MAVTAKTYTVTVGAAGAGSNSSEGSNGSDSSVNFDSGTLTYVGGGYGCAI